MEKAAAGCQDQPEELSEPEEFSGILRAVPNTVADARISKGVSPMVTWSRLSILCLLIALPAAARAFGEVRLSVDGVDLNPSDRELQLVPGVPHRLSFTAFEPGDLEFQGRVTRRLPSGRTVTETRPFRRRISFDLGPLAAPGRFEYEAGAVYFRGYRIELQVTGHDLEKTWIFRQQLSREVTTERLGMGEGGLPVKALRFVNGGPERVIFDPKLGSADLISLRMHPDVLLHQDRLSLLAEIRPGAGPDRVEGEMRVLDASGKSLWTRDLTLTRREGLRKVPVPVEGWPDGNYRVQFLPRVAGRLWPDGPVLDYRRRTEPPDSLLLTPLASWRLRIDPERPEIRVRNFQSAHGRWGDSPLDAKSWGWKPLPDDGVALVGRGDYTAPPVTYRPSVRGTYAVFLGTGGSGLHIQVGREGLIRDAPPTQLGEKTFVTAADLTGEVIRFYSAGDPGKWLDWKKAGEQRGMATLLRLVPVTAESVRKLRNRMSSPPTPLLAVNDWACYFDVIWSRLLPDQFRSIVCGQSELGFGAIGWSVGRSWVEYHSRLPQTTRFPCASYEKAQRSRDYSPHDYGRRIHMINEYDALEQVYGTQEGCRAQVWPWLAMQRHYGANRYGGMFSSDFYKRHPEWWRIAKDGSDSRGLSYYFPRVRKERVDILLEVAERGADGLLVGCDRQVPMLLYNPEMVAAYRKATGVDPRKIDVSAGRPYRDWVRWRADFFTQVLRDLKAGLAARERARERTVPIAERTVPITGTVPITVAVRIPAAGLFRNLAQGLDVERWCREKLVDQLQLDPLQDLRGQADQDIRPYLDLGRLYGIPIVAGMGASAYIGAGGTHSWTHVVEPDGNPMVPRGGAGLTNLVPGLKRALGLIKGGADGIDAYETELLAQVDPIRFLVAMYGHRMRLEEFLRESNLESVAPIDADNAASGHDNHSRWVVGWTLEGFGAKSL